MTDRDSGLSSDELIRRARKDLQSRDLVQQARELLSISEPTDEMERHTGPSRPESTQRRTRDPVPVVTADPATEARPRRASRRPQPQPQPLPDLAQPLPKASGEMIRTDDRIPSGPIEHTRRRSGFGKILLIAAAVMAAVSFLGNTSFSDETSQSEEPVLSEAPANPDAAPATGSVPFDAVTAGMCIQQPSDEIFFTVDTVSCSEPHDFEVIGRVTLLGSEYPGDDAVYDEALDTCTPLFESYVGTSYDTSIWWLNSFTPTEASWNDGDRLATCMVFQYSGENQIKPVTGSARGDGR